MLRKPAILALADGSVFEGEAVGARSTITGELVFNTGVTGYQEMLTDPSYAGQIITFTTPHVGNTGCNSEDMESSRVWANGLIMRSSPTRPSSYRAEHSLPDWLEKHNVVAIAGIDTRALTLRLREKGAMAACISAQQIAASEAVDLAKSFRGLEGLDLAKTVSRQTVERWHEGRGEWAIHSRPLKFHVVVYDFGVKNTILRILHDLGCHLTLVPASTSAAEVMALNPDGVFLSNGPGDPKACNYAIEATRQLLETGTPILGICLGFQLLALACGAKSSKMKFGHHGSNHPVLEVNDEKRVFITSQNHSFSIEETTLPDCLEVTHRSLFDHTLQGIRHKNKPAFGFQGHPEASPGPHDIGVIFERFIELMSN